MVEFNRYRQTPHIRVDDALLAQRRYSGIFDIDDPKSLEDVLANEHDVAIEKSGATVVVRRR